MKYYKTFWTCLFLGAIILLMPPWGSLPKAQDDPMTIDDAIAAAIAAHDADSSAHLGTGASLANHKSNDVLDHPVGSVLGDKKTQQEIFLQTQFENLAAFGTHGSPTQNFPGFRLIPTGTAFSNRKEVFMDGESSGFILDFSKDFLLQFSFQADTYSAGHFFAQLGYASGVDSKNGVGLSIVNGVATFFVTDDGGGSPATLSWPSYTDVTQYVVRVQNVASDGKIYCYVNGELLGTLTVPNTSASDPLYVDFFQYAATTTGHESDVYDMTLVLSLI